MVIGHICVAQGEKSASITSKHEVKLFTQLSDRRKQLNRYEEDIEKKKAFLQAVECNIAKKVEELHELQKCIKKYQDTVQIQEDKKMRSLAKVYEGMNPKRAAQIFNELDLSILVKLVSQMKEVKVAPILSFMELQKAKELSVSLTKKID
ncbi:hypothetical protein FZC37_01840 [Candidatus Sneabacter namystus]|uniref:Magnesium transporter MgtE intracellular domain-containing protein n=2 Tax=Candidatus Sneabacter namystus TaxID=2601646 RepID=A0A5C0UIP6_9RICK|nr:hypothetical protein FZC37_01840 [Candidatus Sneabacter namystus]